MTERTRTCSNPVPSLFGQTCAGNHKETRDCNQEYCSHPVRLVNGSDPYEGRLEVLHHGVWGNVCDDLFDNKAADVVCRMLKYDGVPAAYHSAAYGQGNLTIIMDDVQCSGTEASVFDCKHLSWGSSNCEHGEDVGVSCHANLTARLVDGTSNTNGRVEVSRGDNTWVSVCDQGFDNIAAGIVCKMLSLPTKKTIVYTGRYFGYGRNPSFITDSACSTSDSNLSKCGHFGNCNNYPDRGIACVNTIDVRLVNGELANNGRVEVSLNGNSWGPVCDTNVDNGFAKVICRSMGLPANVSIVYSYFKFGQGAAKPLLSNIACTGREGSLVDCNFGIVPSSCHSVGVTCNTKMYIRLANGTNGYNGRVEISMDGGSWGHICDTNFNSQTATVVCRMLGFPTNNVLSYSGGYFGNGATKYQMESVVCGGNEGSLADCQTYPSNCGGNRDAGVWCGGRTYARLMVNGSQTHSYGNLEVSVDGRTWKPACNGNVGLNEANVVCKMLGFPGNMTLLYQYTYFGSGSGSQQYRDSVGVKCSGSEQSLNNCTFKKTGQCYSAYEVGIACGSGMDVRLVNGTSKYNGRLEISLDGTTWGTVCDSSFGQQEANVVCRMLGASNSALVLVYRNAYFGSGALPYLLGNGGVDCSGSEQSLVHCSFRTNSQCSRQHEVGIVCSPGIHLRLVNGSNSNSGRLEVSFDGSHTWGTVCDDYFNNMAARVVCKMLNLPWVHATSYTDGKGSGSILLDDVQCNGSELSIGQCSHNNWGQHDCSHGEDVGVRCA